MVAVTDHGNFSSAALDLGDYPNRLSVVRYLEEELGVVLISSEHGAIYLYRWEAGQFRKHVRSFAGSGDGQE